MKLAGLGIDVLSISRAKKFLTRQTSDSLSRVLCPSERKCLPRLSPLQFAKIFTAKEAFYKASQTPMTGLYAFSELEVKLLPHEHFEIKWLRSSGLKKAPKVSGCHFVTSDYVGAQVILWEPSSGSR